MEQNLISVIMPVYKTEESHLRKAIESIINQSYRELEIVLVDDGSPDQCGTICDTYAETDNRVQVIHKENGGVSSARNCGLETVTGDYIFFVDSDDTLRKDVIEVLLLTAKNTNSDISVCSCRHMKKKDQNKEIEDCDSAQRCLKTVEQAEAMRNLSYNLQVYEELEPTAVWGKLYKKSVIQNLRFNENMNIGEDFVFNYFAICNSKIVTYCNLKLYDYNFVENSLMNNKVYSPKLMQSFEELVKFENSQRNTKYSDDVIVRCVNIAFTIYLKIPEGYLAEWRYIEEYIKKNRSLVLKNKKAGMRIKVAVCASYAGCKLVRKLFEWTKI